MSDDRRRNPSQYAVVLVSEGATVGGDREMSFAGAEQDQYGHRKLGGVGDRVAEGLKTLSPKFNQGRRVNVVSQRLGYLVRCGAPDALDAIVPMAFGNLALDLVLDGASGRLVCLRNGVYDSAAIDVVVGKKKVVDLDRFYEPTRLRPKYTSLVGKPWFVMTSD
jgi:6-phosphofructokinase 1